MEALTSLLIINNLAYVFSTEKKIIKKEMKIKLEVNYCQDVGKFLRFDNFLSLNGSSQKIETQLKGAFY